jgi:hypothetical protein
MRRSIILTGLAVAVLAMPAAAQAGIGFVPDATTVTALNRDGTLDTQAGSHPYSFSVHFELNTDESGLTEGGEMRDVIIDAPPGLVGNPRAVPSCPKQSFEGGTPDCLPSTQIGVLRVLLPIGEAVGPLYNLVPPPGVAAQFGFSSTGFTALGLASVRSEEGYGVRVAASNLPLEAKEVTAMLWGTPADPGHTPERGVGGGVPSDAPLLPFLTLPTSCAAPPELTVMADSVLAPGVFARETVPLRDKGGQPLALSGCERVPFAPKIQAQTSLAAAGSASGLHFDLQLPNQGLLNSKDGSIAETEPMRTEVTLPAGVAVNPSAANGIAACSLAQYRAESADSVPGQGCPPASRVGTLLAKTPLLEEAIEGSVYLAAPRDNPFNSFLAIYIVARIPERGVLVKQAGEVRADPATGQLTTLVDDLPPIPYSSFELDLREGPRAPMVTPQLCGTYTTTARFYPFSDPEAAVERSAPFAINLSADGTPCAASEAGLPLHPTLEAGSTAPMASAFAPFVFRLSRTDGEQRFSSLEATLPKGLTAKLTGVPYCSEPRIAAARAREVEGGGALEQAAPSCPAASRVGTVNVAAGAGSDPYYVQGTIYLAGPYEGAPLSLAIITPGVAGPFDLGAVVARAGLYVNKSNAVVTVKSDPIPTILRGIPLDIRMIEVNTNREAFTLNPTNCEPMAATGTLTSTSGTTAALSNRFQVGGCRNLAFKPKLSLSLKGVTRRTGHPTLKAVVRPSNGAGFANIEKAVVKLPRSAFLDQAHIRTICTRVQFAADQCPAGSIYGFAKAETPLLDAPLEGPVYLRSSDHELPDLVAKINGQIEVHLIGRINSVHGGIRSSFESVPDAPVSKFTLTMQGGKKGLIVNSTNLCASTNRALAQFIGQNGKLVEFKPPVLPDCKKKSRKHKRGQ